MLFCTIPGFVDSGEEMGDKADTEVEPFTFHMVNSYGSTEVESIRNDDKPIKFSGKCHGNKMFERWLV